jgi:hypothetical protein
MLTGYAEGKAIGIDYAKDRNYADSQIELRRRTTPRTTLGVGCNYTLRRGLLAIGVLYNSCSVWTPVYYLIS